MPPTPSTSRLRGAPPSSSLPPSSSFSSPRPSLSRKGKEKAVYTVPTYDFGEGDEALYQPRSGQLQRKPSRKPKRLSRKSTANGNLGVETITIGSTVGQSDKEEAPRKKRRKLRDDVDALNPSSQPDPTPLTSKKPPTNRTKSADPPQLPDTIKEKETRKKKKTKKSVRLELPVESSDAEYGSGDDDTFRPITEDEDEDDVPTTTKRSRQRARTSDTENSLLANSDLDALDSLDYADPHNLPRSSRQRRSNKYWRSLEWGFYRTSLADTVRGEEIDMAKVVHEWENLIAQKRKDEQETEDKAQDADTEEGQPAKKEKRPRGRPRLPRTPRSRSNSVAPFPKLRRSTREATILNGYSSAGTALGEDEGSGGEGAQDDEVDQLELPSSTILSEMARWPLYPTNLLEHSTTRLDFYQELEELAKKHRRQLTINRPSRPRRSKIRSAYCSSGPLATASDPPPPSSSSSEPDELGDSDTSIAPGFSPQFYQIPSMVNSVLQRLSDFLPKEPLPAIDYWSVPIRLENMRKDREKQQQANAKRAAKARAKAEAKGLEVHTPEVAKCEIKQAQVPGWREVVAVARENQAIPKHVVDKLEQQLLELYGPLSEPEPIKLPALGGQPTFPNLEARVEKPVEPKVRKPRIRKHKGVKVVPRSKETVDDDDEPQEDAVGREGADVSSTAQAHQQDAGYHEGLTSEQEAAGMDLDS
ncbi:uncharacterized protein JCM15063_005878 [Sporobolomyces koalae]|uniref:uncharacterized protein n=1 Tax=Sporobolomyces koalae TaxID=500713 RepID=UPI003174DB76